ncbi:MAG: hypothetical protein ACREWG_02635 [Gammaproteobacteria bacterium]
MGQASADPAKLSYDVREYVSGEVPMRWLTPVCPDRNMSDDLLAFFAFGAQGRGVLNPAGPGRTGAS